MYIKRRDKENNTYTRLQQQSLDMLQQLSGNRWTDFNEHDPGVTIMDVLNYNLLELSYQTGFDFDQYLTTPSRDELRFSSVGLLPGNKIFSPCIVTPQDYEELIETGINGINACEVTPLAGNRYRISIDVNDRQQADRLVHEVENLYHSHRNLCETLEQVEVKKIPKKRRVRQSAPVEYEQQNESIQTRNATATQHSSVQYDFPDTYGINRHGLPSSASELRKSQALQLKGYLLIFDYLLATAKQNLSAICQTLSLSGSVAPPFSIPIDAGDIDVLVDGQKLKDTKLIKTEELLNRKSAYLDMLDALYGEDTNFYEQGSQLSQQAINTHRARLIHRFPQFNTNRFRSFNLKDKSCQSTTGIHQLMQAIWSKHTPTFYVVENVLLQSCSANPADDCNTLYIVFPARKKAFYDKHNYLNHLKERLPVHIDAWVVWLTENEFCCFRHNYFSWRKALATGNKEQINLLGERIREFIISDEDD